MIFMLFQGKKYSKNKFFAYLATLKNTCIQMFPETIHLSLVMRKPTFCICENKDADQLRSDRKADRSLCFRYIDSTIPLLSKSEISSL